MPEFDFAEFIKREQAQKVEKFRQLNRYALPGQILFAGSSLAEWFPINELLQSLQLPYRVYNRGLGGATIDDYAAVMEESIFALQPGKIFLNIGSNDMDRPGYTLAGHRQKLADYIAALQARLQGAALYLIAYYPVREDVSFGNPDERTNGRINEANHMLQALAAEVNAEYIDLNDILCDENGWLKQEFAADRMHMWPEAYRQMLDRLLPYFA